MADEIIEIYKNICATANEMADKDIAMYPGDSRKSRYASTEGRKWEFAERHKLDMLQMYTVNCENKGKGIEP
jgi:hypothetical protein